MQAFGGDIETRVQEYNNRKFENEHVVEEAKKLLGDKYKKQIVVGRYAINNIDQREEFIKECKKYKIEVLKFENVLNEVVDFVGARNYLNPVIRAVQLTKSFLN